MDYKKIVLIVDINKYRKKLLNDLKECEINEIVNFVDSEFKKMGIGTMSYTNSGDSQAKFRSIEWLKNYIFTHEIWKNKKSVLDIGCGNGRVNQLYEKYFEKIVCVDPYVTINNFCEKKVEKFKINFEDFEYNGKFDVIVFIFSLYLFTKKHKEIIEKCLKYLNENGCIIIIEGLEWMNPASRGIRVVDLERICKELNLAKEVIINENEYKKSFKYIFAILRKNEKINSNKM